MLHVRSRSNQGLFILSVTYFFTFATDFSRAGYLAPTLAREGAELFVFNWSPVQWDEAHEQQHYTLKIITPIGIDEHEEYHQLVAQQGLILTETWVNEAYLIDYRRSDTGRLIVVFHRENPGNMYALRTQFYMPASYFSAEAVRKAERSGQMARGLSAHESPKRGRTGLLVGLIVLGGDTFFYLVSENFSSECNNQRKKWISVCVFGLML
ncbi:hypothetical protein JXQ70_10775, partial [bacterium]|nr:hypothetical protein [bacterium]